MPISHPLARHVLASAAFAFLVGSQASCRARTDGTSSDPPASASANVGSRPPTMPTGMLVPRADGTPPLPPPTDVKERFVFGRDKTGSEWAELQIAPPTEKPDRTKLERWKQDSRYLSLDAMTVLSEPFARALPGFDLLLPRFFDAGAVTRLKNELAKFAKELSGLSRSTAIERWSGSSDLVRGLRDEAAWLDARTTLVATLGEVGRFLQGIEGKKATMWVVVM